MYASITFSVPFAAEVIVQYFQIGMQPVDLWCVRISYGVPSCLARRQIRLVLRDVATHDRMLCPVYHVRAGAITIPCSGVMICTVWCFPLVDPVTVVYHVALSSLNHNFTN